MSQYRICLEYMIREDAARDGNDEKRKKTMNTRNLEEESVKCVNTGLNESKEKYLGCLQFHDRLLKSLKAAEYVDGVHELELWVTALHEALQENSAAREC